MLVRDAEITLEQGDRRQSEDDIGFVPLLHLYGEYRTLEGGADNDSVYAFAWLHYAQAAAGYRF